LQHTPIPHGTPEHLAAKPLPIVCQVQGGHRRLPSAFCQTRLQHTVQFMNFCLVHDYISDEALHDVVFVHLKPSGEPYPNWISQNIGCKPHLHLLPSYTAIRAAFFYRMEGFRRNGRHLPRFRI